MSLEIMKEIIKIMKVMYYDNVLVSDLMNDEHLEHHGVLGMKWGIRRYQPYSTVPRKSGKGGTELGKARKTTNKRNRAQSEAYFVESIVSGKDFEVTPGSRIYRATTVDEASLGDRMYVSLYRGDAHRYSSFSDVLEAQYVDEYTPTKSLKICGVDEANKIIGKITGEPIRSDVQHKGYYDESQYFKDYDNWSESRQKKLLDAMDSMFKDPNGLGKKYKNELQKAGYDGVVDLVDLAWGETLTPTIVFTDSKKPCVERRQHYNIDSKILDTMLTEIWTDGTFDETMDVLYKKY